MTSESVIFSNDSGSSDLGSPKLVVRFVLCAYMNYVLRESRMGDELTVYLRAFCPQYKSYRNNL